jgi:hypothetical protein
MKHHWLSVAALISTLSIASPVLEYVDETGAHVFDASGDKTDFEIPQAPREFASTTEYVQWMVKRFHGQPILNAKGELIDVNGAWKLHGTPTYVWNGVRHGVREPIALTVAGRFGYVIVAGTKYEVLIDEGLPPLQLIEPVFLSWWSIRKDCTGSPLGGAGYCVIAGPFKHIYSLYQSIGSTADIQGNVRVGPTTTVTLDVRYQDTNARNLRISVLDTVNGVHRETKAGVGGLGYGLWGIFFNFPILFDTKILASNHSSTGPNALGRPAGGQVSYSWRFP